MCVYLTQVRDGVCVDVSGESLLVFELLLWQLAMREFVSLHSTGFSWKLPEHLHRCAVQNLCEEAGYRGKLTDRQTETDG